MELCVEYVCSHPLFIGGLCSFHILLKLRKIESTFSIYVVFVLNISKHLYCKGRKELPHFFPSFFSLLLCLGNCQAARAYRTGLEFSRDLYIIGIFKAEFYLHRHSF